MSFHARIKQITDDEDFQLIVARRRTQLTKTVMSAATSQEDREKALTDYHALDRVVKGLLSAAQNFEKE